MRLLHRRPAGPRLVQVFLPGSAVADFNEEVESVRFEGAWVHLKTEGMTTSFHAPAEVRVWEEERET